MTGKSVFSWAMTGKSVVSWAMTGKSVVSWAMTGKSVVSWVMTVESVVVITVECCYFMVSEPREDVNCYSYNNNIKYTEILEVNLFAFAYRLFYEDFSPLDGTPSSIK